MTPWIMPRLNIARLSHPEGSDVEIDLGISGGVSFTSAGGLGVHGALDLLAAGDEVTPIVFGAGIHYVLGK